MNIDTLKTMIEHAPAEPGPIAGGLVGCEITTDGEPATVYICARCAGRIMARGCFLGKVSHVWSDQPERIGICELCGHVDTAYMDKGTSERTQAEAYKA